MQNLDIENGVSILDNLTTCLSSFKCIDKIVLGISEGDENLDFIKYAKGKHIEYIIGDEFDVLSRLIKCGDYSNATDIFRTTSESPFPYFEMIESIWDTHCKDSNDATFLDEIIDGCGLEIITLDALKQSHEKGQKKTQI